MRGRNEGWMLCDIFAGLFYCGSLEIVISSFFAPPYPNVLSYVMMIEKMGRLSHSGSRKERKMDMQKLPAEDREKELYQIRISVRDLVEFVLRSGDIDDRRTAGAKKEAMQEGSRLHRKIQKRMGSTYRAEVVMSHTVREEAFIILVEGRADGVIEEPEGVTIDEIKCMYMDITRLEDPLPVHLAQAMCYGYFWCLEKGLSSIGLQLTYCQIETEEIRRFRQEKSFSELEAWFGDVIGRYMKWARYLSGHHQRRQQSLKALDFPYPYREGQRELAVDVYRSIVRGRNLYIQAATGIGKTLSTLFPALKAMGEGYGDKLFYLTAKTMTGRAAVEALDILRRGGLYFSSVVLTAKEKLCFLGKPSCDPVSCPYAKGHFDRVNEAVFTIVCQENAITRDKVVEYARRFMVCPFEFGLDISTWVDGIICDYNYVFDPNVRLKRYFAEGKKGEYLFLIDEAHNLVSRARQMYSAFLVKEDILLVKGIVKKALQGRPSRLLRLLDSCNKSMLALKRECPDHQILENADHLILQLMGMFGELEIFMEENPDFGERELVLDFYFQVRDLLWVFEQMGEGYEIYSQMLPDGDFMVRFFCIDPSGLLKACMDQGIGTILFSATFLPIRYYKELLSGEPEGYAVYAGSPFRQEKRLLLVAEDVSSRYSRRTRAGYEKAARYVHEIVKGKQGNYMVFCPSYQYLGELAKVLEEERENGGFRLLCQESRMDEEQREAFLAEFSAGTEGMPFGPAKDPLEKTREKEQRPYRRESLVALCVMGGIFGEGIDLKEERLIGVLVIGTGLPMVCTEQDILRGYFDRKGKPGFAYAYLYPGMNKVMQAAGRVIRTMEDEGVIALLDDRFLQADHQALFPKEWSDWRRTDLSRVGEQVAAFWKGQRASSQGRGEGGS